MGLFAAALRLGLSATTIEQIVALIPDSWLGDVPEFPTLGEHRAAYRAYLLRRLAAPRAFVEEAIGAHAQLF
jgi:hypothetical protein